MTGAFIKTTDDGIKVTTVDIDRDTYPEPFGTCFSHWHVDKNLICAENLDFDNKALPKWKAQVLVFALNKLRKRLTRLCVDCSKRLGSFMLKILQIKCIKLYEMEISASVQSTNIVNNNT